jgi:hypothetical protein
MLSTIGSDSAIIARRADATAEALSHRRLPLPLRATVSPPS